MPPPFISHCAECDFARYYFTLQIHWAATRSATCHDKNSRKFAIWTTNNGWCSVIQIFTKRGYEVGAFGLTTRVVFSASFIVADPPHRLPINWLVVMTRSYCKYAHHVFARYPVPALRLFRTSTIALLRHRSARLSSRRVVTTTATSYRNGLRQRN